MIDAIIVIISEKVRAEEKLIIKKGDLLSRKVKGVLEISDNKWC